MNRSIPVPQEITSRIAQHLEGYSGECSTLVSLSQNVDESNIPEWLDDW